MKQSLYVKIAETASNSEICPIELKGDNITDLSHLIGQVRVPQMKEESTQTTSKCLVDKECQISEEFCVSQTVHDQAKNSYDKPARARAKDHDPVSAPLSVDVTNHPTSLLAPVLLLDRSLVKMKDIGKSSKSVRLRYVDEPDRGQLEQIMSLTNVKQPVTHPQLGIYVSIKNKVPRMPRFTRGMITKIYVSTRQVVAQLTDYSDEITVSFDQLFQLPSSALHIPPQCFEVLLKG